MIGTIKTLNLAKGFGFIEVGRQSFFFHASACDGTFDSLVVGQRVSFTPTESSKGPRAEDVRRMAA